MNNSETIFQKIINKEISANIEYEDEEIIVIHDISPKASTHLLLIPKKYIPKISDMESIDQEIMGKLIYRAKLIAEKKGLEGYKLLFNVGEKGGQEVFHVHLHLMG